MKSGGKISKITNIILAAVLGLHIGTAGINLANNYHHEKKPSSLRTEFKQEFGLPIRGWSDSIEKDAQAVAIISEVMQREQLERPFTLNSIRIEPSGYLKKGPLEQLYSLIKSHSAFYMLDRVTVNYSSSKWNDVTHEIKHDKTFEVLKQHPELKKKWKELAKDEHGKSLYLNEIEQVILGVPLLDNLIDKEKKNSTLNEKLGFVSSYARTNYLEDIAELGEMAQVQLGVNYELYNWLYGPDANPIIKAKFELAQQYGLISKEFTEYIGIYRQYTDAWGGNGSLDTTKAEPFMKASADFLAKHPNHIYEGILRLSRGSVMKTKASYNSFSNPKEANWQEVIAEYKKGLVVPFKDVMTYGGILRELEEVYRYNLDDNAKADIYAKAEKMHSGKFSSGDVKLARIGVNDFLKVMGEL
jgi:hypothetical protein